MLLITSKKSRPAVVVVTHKYGDTAAVTRF